MLLGLDLGTTNVKAVIPRPDGAVIATGSEPVQVRHLPGGAVEQDIEDIWRATLAAVERAAGACDGSQVRAVGVSSQGGALQVLDAAGEPVGPVIGWQDARGRPWNDRLTAELGRDWFVERTGHGLSGLAVGQLRRLREEGALPEGFRVGFVGDVIVGRLCGRPAHDATSLSLGGFCNPSLRAEDPDVLALLDLSRDRLPDLLPADGAAGGLLAEVAGEVGLPAGIPVSPAVHDQYAAALGCGAVRAGDVMFGAGTAWVLLAVTDRLVSPAVPAAFVCPHPAEGLYGQALSMVNGGSSVSWAIRTLGLEDRAARELDEMMAGVPPGSERLIFLPLLVGGSTGGGFGGGAGRLDGLRLSQGAPHVLRAVVEGLACELTRHLRMLTAARVSVDRLIMCGAAAGSAVTPQIIADATGVPVDCAAGAEMSALGAAVVARALAEPGTPLGAVAREMVPAFKRVEPGDGRPAMAAQMERYTLLLPRPSETG